MTNIFCGIGFKTLKESLPALSDPILFAIGPNKGTLETTMSHHNWNVFWTGLNNRGTSKIKLIA